MSLQALSKLLGGGIRDAVVGEFRSPIGFVKAIHTSGPSEGPDDDGYVTAKAEHMSFDVMIPGPSGGYTVAQGVGFSNPVPSEYKVRVRVGERVWIAHVGGVTEFCIPWLPKVMPCPGAAAARGGSSPFLPVPPGAVGVPDGTGSGGGATAPTNPGQGGQQAGDGGVVTR